MAPDPGRRRDSGAGGPAVVACGALVREILAVKAMNGLTAPAVEAVPALLHNRPEKIPEAVRAKIRLLRAAGHDPIFVAFADCGAGAGLDRVCAEEGARRMAGPHCYAFFSGQAAFAARAETEFDAFYLTDFLARQFDAIVWTPMRLDEPVIREMMFAHYRKLVYLAQTNDPALDAAAEAAARRLGLAYERRFTGYGELAAFIRDAAKA